MFKYDDLHDTNINLDNDDDVQIDMDEVEEIVFNSQIKLEEILKSVKDLGFSKSAGLDNQTITSRNIQI